MIKEATIEGLAEGYRGMDSRDLKQLDQVCARLFCLHFFPFTSSFQMVFNCVSIFTMENT